jgi:hypothetical protein
VTPMTSDDTVLKDFSDFGIDDSPTGVAVARRMPWSNSRLIELKN